MTITFNLVLVVLGLVFLALATLGVSQPPRFQFGWAGIFCLGLAFLVRV